MPDDMPLYLDTAAARLLDLLAFVEPHSRAAVIVFDPRAWDGQGTLYSNAAASDLIPEMEALLARLRAGTLRMAVSGGVRWVDEAED